MMRYEYKVVPAPTKGLKAKGVKTPQGRFANSVESVLNAQADEGWEYLRAELLPSEERTGLTGSTTNWRNVLVFRRLAGPGAGAVAGFRKIEAVPNGSAGAEAILVAGSEPDQPQLPETQGQTPEAARGKKLPTVPTVSNVSTVSTVSGMFAALRARSDPDTGESEDKAAGSDAAQGDKT